VAAATVTKTTSRVSVLLARTASSAQSLLNRKADDEDDEDDDDPNHSTGAVVSAQQVHPLKFSDLVQVQKQRSGSALNRQTSKNLSESIKNMKVNEKKKSESEIGKNSKKDKSGSVKWEEWCLNRLESVQALILVLLLVIITTLYSTLQIVLNLKPNDELATMDFVVSMIFICELSVRMYLYAAVHKQLKSFVKQPLNALDIVVVVLDIVLLSLDAQFLGDAASFAKSLKYVTFG
jgi:hypothetical protein